jgi:acetate kinase
MTNADRKRLLLVNTGSSSVKLTVWGDGRALRSERFGRDAVVDLAEFGSSHGAVEAVTHRVVHAGDLQRHALITPAVEDAVRDASPLAPLHNPMALRYIAAARAAFGAGIPQIAALDTAFFSELPAHAAVYALAPEVGPVRRYGFHGLAHSFMSRRALELDPRKPRRLVTLQLGAGCSAAAILDGRALDTSMGFSPSEGLMMASRSGDVDPGLLVYLLRTRGYSADDLDRAINERGGLLGVCGHGDMREVLRLAASGDGRAALALELYCHRARKIIGAYAAVLGGLDAVVFGGGVGENATEVRERILAPLGWLGLELDGTRNAAGPADRAITAPSSPCAAWVVRLDEAAEMARFSAALLKGHMTSDERRSPR